MSEPRSPENLNNRSEEIRNQIDRHVHKKETRQGWGIFGLGRIFGKHTTSTEYDAKGIAEENRPPEIFRHKGYEPPPLPEGKFITDRKGITRRVGE